MQTITLNAPNSSISARHASINALRDDSTDLKHVQIVVEFAKIGEIDTLNERYQAEFYIEAKWIEKTEITEYDPNVHWNPKIYVENTYQEPKEVVKYDLSRDVDNNLVITEIRHIKGMFWGKNNNIFR
jgi:hypothetical protein